MNDITIQIPLTQGRVCAVDEIDGDLAELKWFAHKSRHVYYVERRPYIGSRKQITVKMHRLIMERILRRALSPSELVDHSNGNGLDNRRSNLRLATRTQNRVNSRRPSNNTSGYKGVYWDAQRNLWTAMIRVDGRLITIGDYATRDEAHDAYKIAVVEHYGDFARIE